MGVSLASLGSGEPPYREVARQFFGGFASLSPKGSAALAPPNIGGVSEGRGGFAPPNIGGVSEGRGGFAPPNIGGVSEGRGGFAALRIPHATFASLLFFLQNHIKNFSCCKSVNYKILLI